MRTYDREVGAHEKGSLGSWGLGDAWVFARSEKIWMVFRCDASPIGNWRGSREVLMAEREEEMAVMRVGQDCNPSLFFCRSHLDQLQSYPNPLPAKPHTPSQHSTPANPTALEATPISQTQPAALQHRPTSYTLQPEHTHTPATIDHNRSPSHQALSPIGLPTYTTSNQSFTRHRLLHTPYPQTLTSPSSLPTHTHPTHLAPPSVRALYLLGRPMAVLPCRPKPSGVFGIN